MDNQLYVSIPWLTFLINLILAPKTQIFYFPSPGTEKFSSYLSQSRGATNLNLFLEILQKKASQKPENSDNS